MENTEQNREETQERKTGETPDRTPDADRTRAERRIDEILSAIEHGESEDAETTADDSEQPDQNTEYDQEPTEEETEDGPEDEQEEPGDDDTETRQPEEEDARWRHAVELARAAGFGDEDIAGFDTPDELRGAVRLVQRYRQYAANAAENDQNRNGEREPEAKLDPEQFDPELIKYFEGMKNRFDQKYRELDERYRRLEQEREQERYAAQRRELEDAMDRLPDTVKSAIGYGLDRDARTPAQIANTDRLIDRMDELEKGSTAKNRRRSLSQLLEEAARLEFFDEIASGISAGVGEKLRRRGAAIMPRSSGKSRSESASDYAAERIDQIIAMFR